jgi:hypothetical protein
MKHYFADKHEAKRLFPLGHIFATPGAVGVAYEHGIKLGALVARHVCGDWGDLADEDKQANDVALQKGLRIFSAYGTDPVSKLWVITEADRSQTTILRPSEY